MDTGPDPTYASAGNETCPYLGRCDDPDSFYSFPTPANCCHATRPPLAIEPLHQESVCLGGDWPACRWYKAALAGDEIRPGPAASRLRRPAPRAPPTWSIVSIVALVSMLLGGLMGGLIVGLLSNGLAPSPSRTSSDLAAVVCSPASTAERTAFTRDSQTPLPVLGTTSTQPPTATPSRTPTRTPVPTLTPLPTVTPSLTAAQAPRSTATRRATESPSATSTPSRTPVPATSSPRPTRRPTATSTLLPAPLLLTPSERQEFTEDAEVVLTWQPVGELPPDAYYQIIVAYSHLGATWLDEVPWTRDTSWILSEHRHLLELCDDGQFRWSVQVVRQTGVEDDGRPVGVPITSPSEVRTFLWRRASGGGEKPPENTPVVPPP